MEYWNIVEIADKLNIQKEVIDKDWVLGHFLNAMFSIPEISKNFIFKGGTCLKKVYFPDYRFSEDLDFTLCNKDFIIDTAFVKKIIKIAEKTSGALYHLKKIKLQTHNDIPQGYEVIILFWGAYHKPNQRVLPVNRWQTKIKLDISFSERVVLQPLKKTIYHFYVDSDKINSIVTVYPLVEIIAEKLRSLMQRNRPRDIYDLYYLADIILPESYRDILAVLKEKSVDKNIDCCQYDNFVNRRKYKNNKRAWKNSLEHHLPKNQLVDYDLAYTKVEQFVKEILKSD